MRQERHWCLCPETSVFKGKLDLEPVTAVFQVSRSNRQRTDRPLFTGGAQPWRSVHVSLVGSRVQQGRQQHLYQEHQGGHHGACVQMKTFLRTRRLHMFIPTSPTPSFFPCGFNQGYNGHFSYWVEQLENTSDTRVSEKNFRVFR